MQDQELRALRRELAPRARGRGLHYPKELRQRIARCARRQLDEGAELGTIATALGVHRDTLRRWTADPAAIPSPALVPVEVVADCPRSTHVSVVSPTGFRIEGLTIDEAVTVLARLR